MARHCGGFFLAIATLTMGAAEPSRGLKQRHSPGYCYKWLADTTGCDPSGQTTCSANLSPGPAGADIVAKLGNLPPSTPGNEVYLHWWAPRKSVYPYKPLEHPNGCAVYRYIDAAYPNFHEDAFNGGNVRVDEGGLATIKLRSPATYQQHCWIKFPHVHLRVCTKSSMRSAGSDALFFGTDGAFLLGEHNIQILSLSMINDTAALPTSSSTSTTSSSSSSSTTTTTTSSSSTTLPAMVTSSTSFTAPTSVMGGVMQFTAAGVSSAQVASAARTALAVVLSVPEGAVSISIADTSGRRLASTWKVEYSVMVAEADTQAVKAAAATVRSDTGGLLENLRSGLLREGADATTLGTSLAIEDFSELKGSDSYLDAEGKTTDESVVDLRIQAALAALDLDALEFSPVYRCLLEGKFFSQFDSECSETCPAEGDVAHGQCVQSSNGVAHSEFEATWKLRVNCGQRCWGDRKNTSMHFVRLGVADLLDIPFQEVVNVSMKFLSATTHRLSTGNEVREAYLQVSVFSQRITETDGLALLGDFMDSATIASDLLGLQVESVAKVSGAQEGGSLDGDSATMTKDNDPYNEAYLAAERDAGLGGRMSTPGSPEEFLPPVALAGIAAAVLVLGLGAGVCIYVRRRQASRAAANNVQGKAIPDKNLEASQVGISAEKNEKNNALAL